MIVRASIRTLCLSLAVTGATSFGEPLLRPPSPQDGTGTVPPTDVPRPRTDLNSEIAHSELVAKARTGVIDVYFVGDSITRRWGALDYPGLLANWNENFLGWNAANFGWGGDRTENILWRLENGELDGVDPKVIVVQAGTNNLGDRPDAAADSSAIAAGIHAIVETCRRKAPAAVIVLTGVFPRGDEPSFNTVIARINRDLRTIADGDRVRFLDINDGLSGVDGRLLEAMSVDGLHLSVSGYQIWADRLKPVLTGILGPRTDSDQAPPPTGNPAAR